MRTFSAALRMALPFAMAAASSGPWKEDASAFVQGRTGSVLAIKDTSIDTEGVRSLLLKVKSEIARHDGRAQASDDVGATHVALSAAQAQLGNATQFIAMRLGELAGKRRSDEACNTACGLGIALDAVAILLETGAAIRGDAQLLCTVPTVVEWWLMGILTLTLDQKLDFPEALHMLTQQVTTIGYGSTPPKDKWLQVFHSLHGFLSLMGPARVMNTAVDTALDILDIGLNKTSFLGQNNEALRRFVALSIVTAASTVWFTADKSAAGKSFVDSLIGALYQAFMSMTTIGYGDEALETKWSKVIGVPGLPLLTGAFAKFAEKFGVPKETTPEGEEADVEEEDAPAEPPAMCKCFGRNICPSPVIEGIRLMEKQLKELKR